jgi:tetratricopeptide (TPR) repeat protein
LSRTKLIIAIVGLILGMAVVFWLNAGAGQSGGGQAIPIYRNVDEAAKADQEAKSAFESLQLKILAEQKLTEQEKAVLRGVILKGKGVLAFDPDKYDVYFRQGQVYLALNQADEGIDQLRKYLEVAPKEDVKSQIAIADAHYMLSVAYFAKLNHEEALREIDKALDLYPETVNYLFQRVRVLYQLNRKADAKADAVKILRIDPMNPKIRALIRKLNKEDGS